MSSSTRNRNRKMKKLNIGQLLNGVYPVFLTKPHSTPFSACIAERFHVNAIFREQFHESIWHRLEKHFSSLNNALRRYLVVRRFPKPRSKPNGFWKRIICDLARRWIKCRRGMLFVFCMHRECICVIYCFSLCSRIRDYLKEEESTYLPAYYTPTWQVICS